MNNVLIVGPPNSGKIRICQFISRDLETSTIPQSSHSGLIYSHQVETKYFTAAVNLLVEEYPSERENLGKLSGNIILEAFTTFYEDFKQPEFLELREALNGIIFTLPADLEESVLECVLEQLAKIRLLFENENHLFYVVVTVGQSHDPPATEDVILLQGFEYIDFDQDGHNEFMDKVGKARLKELFDTHEWKTLDLPKHLNLNPNILSDPNITPDHGTSATLGLLNETELSFDEILKKLAVDKERVQNLPVDQRKAFVDSLVDEYMGSLG